MPNAIPDVERPINEPILSYLPGSSERLALKQRLREMKAEKVDIPLIIGGREVRTGKTGQCIVPHDRGCTLGSYHIAGDKEVQDAVAAALAAKREWEDMP